MLFKTLTLKLSVTEAGTKTGIKYRKSIVELGAAEAGTKTDFKCRKSTMELGLNCRSVAEAVTAWSEQVVYQRFHGRWDSFTILAKCITLASSL